MIKQGEVMNVTKSNHLLSMQSFQNLQDPNLLPFLIQNSNDPNSMNLIKSIINNNNLSGMLQMNDEIFYKRISDDDGDEINSLKDEPYSKRLRIDEKEFESSFNEGKQFFLSFNYQKQSIILI
jgi:hypothetical protein